MMKKLILLLSLSAIIFNLNAQNVSEIPEGKAFYIQSAMNYGQDDGGYWDIPGSPDPVEKGSNIQVWRLDSGKDRKFYLKESSKDGYYEIIPASASSNMRLDVDGGSRNMKNNGTNIKIWEKNTGDWQRFRFKHFGDGKFKIFTPSGMAICLAGRDNDDGSNVHIWEDHNGDWMEWYLIDAETNKKVVPAPPSEDPEFFIRNKDKTFEYKQYNAYAEGSEGTAVVKEIKDDAVVLSVTSTGRNHSNGKIETRTFDYEIAYKDGKYSKGEGEGALTGTIRKDADGNESLDLSGEYGGNTFKPMTPDKPMFFIENKDKTFKYKQYNAYVAGSEGTAVVKEIKDDAVVLSVTSTGRNQSNGKMETRTFDYELAYKDGKYSKGEGEGALTGTIRKDADGNEYLDLSGEYGGNTFIPQK